ncbi:double-strand break repair helicase AddA [Sandarakinorhabdus sp.]|uniref:double-strand break repair helicase AddA n=1 Tax=Sandarakinorhabdus sp. TaxID=1916663 RepID=UPI00286EA5BA|nr:double-strand break repair helicase AddA [Sandarakinorhabdus sp.]
MNTAAKALLPLRAEQADAADPAFHAWVAAAAGTGKTQVLSARVLRLLLDGTRPEAILCLTFTKLAAAEMLERVTSRLASWTRCDDAALASDIRAIGAEPDADMLARARQLFLDVLDTPAGLAIETIHAFCQALIASFPIESGVAPGFVTLDDRAGQMLQRRVLTDALQAEDDAGFRADVEAISLACGEGRISEIAKAAASHAEALGGLRPEGALTMLRRGFGLAADAVPEAVLAERMADIDDARLARIAAMLAAGGKRAFERLDPLAKWRGSPTADNVDYLFDAFLTKAGTVAISAITKASIAFDSDAADDFLALAKTVAKIKAEQALFAAADLAAQHIRVAIRLARDWTMAKARGGVIDYGDMISAARTLLEGEGAAGWVRYKLDQRIDHVLVDEAQDTNDDQWRVVQGITSEFFSGQGARDYFRSQFVVGDFKQSIFGFQGANPRVYAAKREHFVALTAAEPGILRERPLATNFRSAAAILRLVDQVIDVIGEEQFDPRGVPDHSAFRDTAGSVTLWPPLMADPDAVTDDQDEDGDNGSDSDGAAPAAVEVRMAHKVAASIARWLDPRAPLRLPSTGKPVQPQDILVLVRRRSGFSSALVSALHVHGVPVAGVDRLKLTDPLAVADLMALVRFVLQPGDDLTLAALLVSPFGGLDHDRLTALAAGRTGTLWAAVLASEDAGVVAARDWLGKVQGLGKRLAPYEFLESVLSGPLMGRQRLLARLGEEARDAIDTMLDQALAFEAASAPSLQGFLAWLTAEDFTIKRDPEAMNDAVRLMTVHGAKGLQAPIVVLADACYVPKGETGPLPMALGGGLPLPVFLRGKIAPGNPLGDAMAARTDDALREHCRLLYVALTRAEDLLFIGGAVAKPNKERQPSEKSWYTAIARAMAGLNAVAGSDPEWEGAVLTHAEGEPKSASGADLDPAPSRLQIAPWAMRPPAEEARPLRPLSPSTIAGDDIAQPPPDPVRAAAARRGNALHRLFELLPDVPPDRRREAGLGWARANVPEFDGDALVATVLAVLDDPAFAEVFAPGALTEAPVAAMVGEMVIAGSVDRLLVGDDAVMVVDFKTGRRVPDSADDVPVFHLRQMAAYAAALAVVFPGRRIRAALLFTQGPRLIDLPDALLALHHPGAALSLQSEAGTPILAP